LIESILILIAFAIGLRLGSYHRTQRIPPDATEPDEIPLSLATIEDILTELSNRGKAASLLLVDKEHSINSKTIAIQTSSNVGEAGLNMMIQLAAGRESIDSRILEAMEEISKQLSDIAGDDEEEELEDDEEDDADAWKTDGGAWKPPLLDEEEDDE